jgi:hypothetical protein
MSDTETSKCQKCRTGINETFQRGALITGTRCLSCGYQTFAKICKNVGELRLFLEKMPDPTQVLFQDDACHLKLEAHFTGDMASADRVKVWRGTER